MRSQAEAYKPGERSLAGGRYFCPICDARKVETVVTLDAGEVFPLCPTCTEAQRPETDQLWVELSARENYRRATTGRWREMWKVS